MTHIRMTPREREILSLIAAGRSTHEIAGDLHIAYDTVKTYLRRTMATFKSNSRAYIVAESIRLGILVYDDNEGMWFVDTSKLDMSQCMSDKREYKRHIGPVHLIGKP